MGPRQRGRVQRMRSDMPAQRWKKLHLHARTTREEDLPFRQGHHRMGSRRWQIWQGHLLLQGAHRRRLERMMVVVVRWRLPRTCVVTEKDG